MMPGTFLDSIVKFFANDYVKQRELVPCVYCIDFYGAVSYFSFLSDL
jgi:hypothetical protein